MPLVSVCLPTYNGARHVAEALRSVLDQDGVDLEVVVADDGSTDGTLEVVTAAADERVVVLEGRGRRGVAANWNRALDAASAPFVKVMGQDDLLRPGALAGQVAALTAEPEAVMSFCLRDLIDDRGRTVMPSRGPRRLRGLVDARRLVRIVVRSGTNLVGEPVAVLLRAAAAKRIGGFDDRRPYVIDLDYWCRLLGCGPAVAEPVVRCAFRVSPESWSAALAREQFRQVRGLLGELRASSAGTATRADLAVGVARAAALAAARRVLYARLRRGNR